MLLPIPANQAHEMQVKCDKRASGCDNCQHIGVQCPGLISAEAEYSSSQVSNIVTRLFADAGVDRRKYGSCQECRTSKSKCSRDRPKCFRCERKSLHCSYPGSAVRDRSQSPNGSMQGSSITLTTQTSSDWSVNSLSELEFVLTFPLRLSSNRLPEAGPLKILVESFFDHVHPLRCLGFLHKPSFLHALDQGIVSEQHSEALLYTICALGAR